MADYYCCASETALKSVLPDAVRKEKEGWRERLFVRVRSGAEGIENLTKRQMEIYQWLLRGNGLNVSDTAYFIYCNGQRRAPRFDKHLDFNISVIPYAGNDDWVEACIVNAHACLVSSKIPPVTSDCDYCTYYSAVTGVIQA